MDFVVELGERGFRSDLVNNALETMRRDVERLMTSYRLAPTTTVVEVYQGPGEFGEPVSLFIDVVLLAGGQQRVDHGGALGGLM